MLSCYRILDLTDEKGFLCGKVLGDLGADVIKIEKPGGDDSRRRGPFFHDIPDPEKSLYWFAYNSNKRGITLNIESSDGKELFKELMKTADVVIESSALGYMDHLGLGYSILHETNPKVVLTSITPFGREGPYKDYKGPDIVVHALSGLMYRIGDRDRPPLAPSYSHAHLIGAIFGAIGTLIALYHRHSTGRGQWVDASTQQGLVFASSVEFQAVWALYKEIQKRTGGNSQTLQIKGGKKISHPLLWRCKDGRISFNLTLGPSGEKGNKALAEWMKKEGFDPGFLGHLDWKKMDWSNIEKEEIEEIFQIIAKFFLQHTKSELFEASLKMGFHIGPILTFEEMLKFPQHIQREFWIDIEHPELGTTITYPGGFSKMTGGTCGIRRRAPLIGEHNMAVYEEELGISRKDLIDLKQRRII